MMHFSLYVYLFFLQIPVALQHVLTVHCIALFTVHITEYTV